MGWMEELENMEREVERKKDWQEDEKENESEIDGLEKTLGTREGIKELIEANIESLEVIEDLESMGEDVGESKKIIAERFTMIREAIEKIETQENEESHELITSGDIKQQLENANDTLAICEQLEKYGENTGELKNKTHERILELQEMLSKVEEKSTIDPKTIGKATINSATDQKDKANEQILKDMQIQRENNITK